MMSTLRTTAVPLVLAIAAATSLLSACAPIVVGGAAAGTAVVATDRRTSGTQLEDQNIAFKVEHAMSQKFGDTARINADSYEGRVLLTGDAPSEAVKEQATGVAKGVENVKTVFNQINVGPLASFGTRSNDTWITSKVRNTLLSTKFVPSGSISITTDRGVVYLQGKVTQTEGEYAANAVAGLSGVVRVVKLFDTISRDEAVRLSNSGPKLDSNSSNNASQTQVPADSGTAPGSAPNGDSGVQAIPIK